MKIIKKFFVLSILALFSPTFLNAQNDEIFTLTEAAIKGDTPVELGKLKWKYRAGDDLAWAARELDDAAWETIDETTVKPEMLERADWNGRAWFRLRFRIEDKLANQNIVFSTTQRGASEIFIDGERLAQFGAIGNDGVLEYNPNRLPIPFRVSGAGEHTIAVRFASAAFSDARGTRGRWLTSGGILPGFSPVFYDGSDLIQSISGYASYSSMSGGFLFAGFLLALALLHFLLYIFYRVERANLFYSIFAASFAVNILCGSFRSFGHQGTFASVILSLTAVTMLAVTFTVLPAFLLVAFKRRIGRIFWTLTTLWIIFLTLFAVFLNQYTIIRMLPNIMIGLSFTYCIMLLIKALIEKRSGAWILFGGVLALQLGMLASLLTQFGVVNLQGDYYFIAELGILLGVPISVSVFLARNFARTNRDLQTQLVEVERLSEQQIEQERHAAELRAENERRAKELEEARQLQLSMLPSKIPQMPNLEIAAYMKPATEVGGDYYDFYMGDDGTLTIAIGDATGHGLKAGTVVTATKGLFNNLAPAPDIPDTFRQISRSLKAMNLRGLFMAMTILKVKNNQVSLSVAGMPSVLIYRNETRQVEEISIRAMPLGSVAAFPYESADVALSLGDTIVLMSDGFPEMFNVENEMIGFEKAAEILPEIAGFSTQEIINRLVKIGENWAGARPADDDVTFVVMKAT